MQVAESISKQVGPRRVLYASAEETVSQIGLRVKRLKNEPDSFKNVDLVNEPNLSKLLSLFHSKSPYAALFIDSIQTVFLENLENDTGGLTQVRACTIDIVQMAKALKIPVVIIG